MDPEAPVGALCLHKETRTSLKPPAGLEIHLSVPTIRTFDARPRQQHRGLKAPPIFKDQESFTKHYIASNGSIHFSQHARHPRRFLWRVVQDQRGLEIRSVDLSKSDRETKEATFAVRLSFSTQIKNGGVALADTENPNLLEVFVLTKSNEIYTCSLPKDYFCHSASWREGSSSQPSMVAAVAKPATFSVASPHRLVAGSALQLIVSLSDGRLLRLTRRIEENGSQWHESIYGDGKWGSSLRGLIRWQGSNTVRYEGTTLEQTTPIAMAVSPDNKHIFAVCMNHLLRVWNPKNAASVVSIDLLWQPREPNGISKIVLDPGNPNVLQLFKTEAAIDGDLYYAVTFSPQDVGQFKFWGIRDPDHGELGVRDLFPEDLLKAPDPDPNLESKAIWKIADFKVNSGQEGQEFEMWILMRSNRDYRLYNLKSDFQDLAQRWRDQWTVTVSGSTGEHPFPLLYQQPEDLTNKWLDHIFCPGKYPEYALESALAIYCNERGVSSQDPKVSLQERMCSAVELQASVGVDTRDYELYAKSTHQEWTSFWQGIQDLDQSRWSVLSLAHDDDAAMPWIVSADGCSVIRTCSRLEVIAHNKPVVLAKSMDLLEFPSVEMEGDEPKLPDELALIIDAAAAFRQMFSYRALQTWRQVLATELWLDPSLSVPLRIEAFYERCNFSNEIQGPQYEELEATFSKIGGIENLDTELFHAILERFAHDLPEVPSNSLYTPYGLTMLTNGAREMINLRVQILSDLLMLVVIIEVDSDRDADQIGDYNGPKIYVELLDLLKQHQIMQWLAKNVRLERGQDSERQPPAVSKSSISDGDRPCTLLESIFAKDLKPQPYDTQPQSEALTQSIQDLLKWVIGGHDQVPFSNVPVYIQCNLLVHQNIDLAADFLRYQPSTPFSTYIKGRLSLLKGDFTETALYFQKAAFKLSRPTKTNYNHASDSLLTALEAAFLGHGLQSYYTHITTLFSPLSPTQTAHFAHLALQLPSQTQDQATALLTILFTASIATSNIPAAFSSLIRHPSPKPLLEKFLTTLLSTPGGPSQLLTLSFPPDLLTPIDTFLGAHCRNPKVQAAWRLHRQDFRGAAAALLPPLQRTQVQAQAQFNSRNGLKRGGVDAEAEFLTVINLLSCAGEDGGWVLSGGGDEGAQKRKVVTVDDLRSEYQKWLDGGGKMSGGGGVGGEVF